MTDPSSSPRHFCTYFDGNYLHRGLALYSSLQRSCRPFVLWILCFDRQTYEIVETLRLPEVRLIGGEEFVSKDPELRLAQGNRSRVEFYWTCTPCLPLFIFRHNSDIEQIVYVDADIYFFSSLGPIEDELRSASILINLQDLSIEYADHQAAGKFNVGVMAFRNDCDGRACLMWWREQCLQSCRYRPEEGLYGDQHMLDDWPERFKGVVVSTAKGLRAAPWNIGKYEVRQWRGDAVLINGEPLICFHFHALRFCSPRLIFLIGWKVGLTRLCVDRIYRPYVIELLTIERRLHAAGVDARIPTSGLPWRYIAGRVVRRQPIRNFLWLGTTLPVI